MDCKYKNFDRGRFSLFRLWTEPDYTTLLKIKVCIENKMRIILHCEQEDSPL